ncbi:glycine-rich domain-containing protein [Flavobacterium sp. HJ-32-4]|uniref:glycine-rich domain-containing protein n=1 Tax=Flavobacterium sp. HJ-32-4 TaxID=1160795 RepID=UPI001F147EF4|nr:Ig-like domain-containing protein [Flavobacterium sp. HJ-32-4]UMY66100.1 Ig-like domain-containing protein [Flavobacterium sp. HJ-32-4]
MQRTIAQITSLRVLSALFMMTVFSGNAQSISGPTSARVGQTALLSTPGFSSFVLPTGGTITTIGNDRIHTFTSADTFVTAQNLYGASLLVVGGGGGGGFNGGGGGGAGGYSYNPSFTLVGGTYPVTVGSGGLGSTSASATGLNGGPSSFGSVATMPGGGGGATRNLATPGGQGGSGGGGAGSGIATSTSCMYSVDLGTSGGASLTVFIDGVPYGSISAQSDPESGTAGTASMNFPVKSGQTITATPGGEGFWVFYNGPNESGQSLGLNLTTPINLCTAGGSDNAGNGTINSKGGKGTPFDAGCLAAGGGGGGAGGAGANATNDMAGVGGAGLQNNITGTSLWYAAGGGGGLAGYSGCGTSTAVSPGGAPGGSGIGGNGETTAGAANTGSGGGAEKNGGSGVVVVRYPLPQWWSSNPSIATAEALTGVVTGVSAGTTTINCNYAGNLFSVSFTVTAPAPALTITGTTSLCPGKTSDLNSGRPDYVAPTGGIITTIGNERIHTFTASGSFNSPQPIYGARILAIGGGGGGASDGAIATSSGGGGAGAYVYLADRDIPSGNQAVTVGVGGVGGVHNGTGSGSATTFISALAAGGGFGASEGSMYFAANGGSGGGSSVGTGAKVNGGLGTVGYGYQGGNSVYSNSCTRSGGGGGAGGPGQSGTVTGPGMGGLGLQNDISGTALWYAGGGGGYSDCGGGAAGGSGVGGNGGVSDGAPNTGSGGGGGKNGGSGVLVIRYTIPAWTSSNPAVATVDAVTGLVSAISAGTTTISYTSFEGDTVSVPVTVSPPYIVPTFTQRPPVCKDMPMAALPTTSLNGITGTWSPAINTSQTTTYTFTPTNGQCALPTTMTVPLSDTTTWNGTTWSNGTPDGIKNVTIAADLDIDYDLNACALTVTNNADVTVVTNSVLTVQNEVIVDPGAMLTIESDANLLQKSTATVNTNVGTIRLKRQAFMNRLDYVYWGSPVSGQNLQAFSPATLPNRFYTLNESTSAFVPVDPATNSFTPGKGIIIRAPNNYPDYPLPKQSFMGTFTGVPNNGNYSVTVYKSGPSFGYNLLANPYPSTLDAYPFIGNNNRGTIYFYVHQSLLGGGYNYVYYNLSGSIGSATGIESLGYIQPGQGFLYRPNAAVVNVTFRNSMRMAVAYEFYRTANPDRHRYWLNLNKGGSRMGQLLVGYFPEATDDFDGGYDGSLIPGGNSMSVDVGEETCGIVAKPLPFEENSTVPLHLHIEDAGSYSIAYDHADGLFDQGQQIYVKDTALGVTHNVSASPYEFLSEAGDFPDRLQIVYQQGPTLGTPEHPSTPWEVVVYPANGKLHVEGSAELKSVRIFDLRGRLLYEKNQIGATTAELDGFFPTGSMVLLKITGNEGETTKKVVF